MDTLLLRHEEAIRSSAFYVAIAGILLWEAIAPRRPGTRPTLARWGSNLGLYLTNTVISYGFLPVFAVGMAMMAEVRGWGVLRQAAVPPGVAILLSLVVLDLSLYVEHRLFHRIPWLWRLHRVHHADPHYDFTTAVRFHPIEALLEIAAPVAIVAVLGAPVVAVVLFEALVGAQAIVSHANARLHLGLDRVVRRLVVTPDMHRVHHSTVPRETDSNFGNILSVWDRLFGTYRDQPAAGHENMVIGLAEFRDPRRLTLPWLLALPFLPDRKPVTTADPARA
ncbi:MAG TPA: sterol desaturase family protein [Methylomirabilota bacterium]|nr:sterol desaturase family protein [Methylomirabilota bacterium]